MIKLYKVRDMSSRFDVGKSTETTKITASYLDDDADDVYEKYLRIMCGLFVLLHCEHVGSVVPNPFGINIFARQGQSSCSTC